MAFLQHKSILCPFCYLWALQNQPQDSMTGWDGGGEVELIFLGTQCPSSGCLLAHMLVSEKHWVFGLAVGLQQRAFWRSTGDSWFLLLPLNISILNAWNPSFSSTTHSFFCKSQRIWQLQSSKALNISSFTWKTAFHKALILMSFMCIPMGPPEGSFFCTPYRKLQSLKFQNTWASCQIAIEPHCSSFSGYKVWIPRDGLAASYAIAQDLQFPILA